MNIMTDVIIAGAGPVGLGLAIELGLREVRTIVIDETIGTAQFPSYNWWSWSSVETLRRWGIADELRYSGFPSDYSHTARYTTGIEGFEIVSFPQPSNREAKGSQAFSPESDLWSPNYFAEPVLRRKAASFPSVRLIQQRRLGTFTQFQTGVTAEVEDLVTGQVSTITAKYLVGCDGARSIVRDALGTELRGVFATDHQLAIHFRSPLQEVMSHQPCVHTWILKPEVRALLVAVNGKDRWRCGPLGLRKDEVESRSPLEWLHLILGDTVPIEVLGARPWGGHYAVADSFGRGRVFLAGDAAHLMWPAGGFGMNTGLGDAVNLGWKLAAAVGGWAGPRLLASYRQERQPLAKERVEGAGDRRASDGFGVSPLLGADGPEGAALRAKVAAGITASERGAQWKTNLPGTDLGYVYRDTPLSEADVRHDAQSTRDIYRPTAQPGARAPHAILDDGRSLLDSFGTGFTLLAFDSRFDAEPLCQAASARGVPLSLVLCENGGARALYDADACLVRPDGVVAWRGDAASNAQAEDVVARVTGFAGTS